MLTNTTENITLPQINLQPLIDSLENYTAFWLTEDGGTAKEEDSVDGHYGAIIVIGMMVVFIALVFCQTYWCVVH